MSLPGSAVAAGYVLAAKYRLEGVLGQGGMGAVWRAEHLGLRAPVAVKLMNPLIASSPEALGRFHREAHAAAALRSQHVVQVLDYGIDEPTHTPFIVMELLSGESLASRLARVGRLPVPEVAQVITQVCRALSRAHELGIVHRDLKPDNVFLVREDDHELAKVLDFGIAKSQSAALAMDASTQTGMVLGTPYYMSPEQIRGSKDVDFRSDLWSVAVIASECLVGRRVFSATTLGELAVAICADPLPVPSVLAAVPPGFDAWFARALARDPAARFPSARALAEELARVCREQASSRVSSPSVPELAHGVTPPPQTERASAFSGHGADTANPLYRTSPVAPATPSSLRWWLASGAAVAVVLVAAIAWIVATRRPAGERPASVTAAAAPAASSSIALAPPAAPVASADSERAATAPSVDAGSSLSPEPAHKSGQPRPPSLRTRGTARDAPFGPGGVLDQRR